MKAGDRVHIRYSDGAVFDRIVSRVFEDHSFSIIGDIRGRRWGADGRPRASTWQTVPDPKARVLEPAS